MDNNKRQIIKKSVQTNNVTPVVEVETPNDIDIVTVPVTRKVKISFEPPVDPTNEVTNAIVQDIKKAVKKHRPRKKKPQQKSTSIDNVIGSAENNTSIMESALNEAMEQAKATFAKAPQEIVSKKRGILKRLFNRW